MNFYVSIVSHGHYDFICRNSTLLDISMLPNVTVVVKDNIADPLLSSFCQANRIIYLTSNNKMGFGENNNSVYNYCREKLGMASSDFFLTLNPDVVISASMFVEMMNLVNASPCQLFTIDLYRDNEFKDSEQSLRFFPTWKNLANLIMNKPVCRAYSKESLSNYAQVDWASGAFLGFKSSLYEMLEGFDTRYFMYYEDVDICYRAKYQFDASVHFLKDIKAIHFGAYQNRNFLSKHFRWYLSSLIKFIVRTSSFGK